MIQLLIQQFIRQLIQLSIKLFPCNRLVLFLTVDDDGIPKLERDIAIAIHVNAQNTWLIEELDSKNPKGALDAEQGQLTFLLDAKGAR
jgi:hypothetical protein